MKNPRLTTLAAAIAVTCTAVAGTKTTVPVQPYEAKNYTNPAANFEVNATSAWDLEKSAVWFGGKVTNKTGSDAQFDLIVSFFDASGNGVAGTTFTGTVKGRDSINVPEKQIQLDISRVKEIHTAKYLLILK